MDVLDLEAGVHLLMTPSSFSLFMDAPSSEWEAREFGHWEVKQHTSVLDIRAILPVFTAFQECLAGNIVALMFDSLTVATYFNKWGGTVPLPLCLLMHQILSWLEPHCRDRHFDRVVSPSQYLWRNLSTVGKTRFTLFATSWKKKLPIYIFLLPTPCAWKEDAFQNSWSRLEICPFPPSMLNCEVIIDTGHCPV